MNAIGKILTLTTFGESHGVAMGGILDGVPAGADIDLDELQRFVDRRRTRQAVGSSTRDEKDRVEVLSGGRKAVGTGQGRKWTAKWPFHYVSSLERSTRGFGTWDQHCQDSLDQLMVKWPPELTCALQTQVHTLHSVYLLPPCHAYSCHLLHAFLQQRLPNTQMHHA